LNTINENNFRQLFDTNNKKVFNISLNIVQNIEDAEDITQEVFIEVYRSFPEFNEKSNASTWIYRIAVNKSLDFLRAKKRKKRFALITQLFNGETGKQLHEVSNFDHPGTIMENKECSLILFMAIDHLAENQKTAFILSRIEGFSQKETAQIMDISEKAVESLLQRAKENLKKLLENVYRQQRI